VPYFKSFGRDFSNYQKRTKDFDIGDASLNGYEHKKLFRNNGNGTFTDIANAVGADRLEDGRGVALIDFDSDGYPDILLRNYRMKAALYCNANVSGNNYLNVRLTGTKSNRDAIGAKIKITSAGKTQMREVYAGSGFLSMSTLTQFFGLGKADKIDTLEVLWPSGAKQVFKDIPVNRMVKITEGKNEPVIEELKPRIPREMVAAALHEREAKKAAH
jgi:hypothetical protein